MASSQFMADNDAYVDVDAILDRYRKSRAKILFLVGAIVFIFLGTISGYSALQISMARLHTLSATTIELATATAESEKCIQEPTDKICITAKELVADPDKAKNMPPATSKNPYPIPLEATSVEPFDFHTDPTVSMIAFLLTQPFILRLQ
jgi:hypothetical protein